MPLTETDSELLEFVALSEPWSLVCGEFCPRYGTIEELVVRLTGLASDEYLLIEAEPGASLATAQSLLADALRNGLYEDVVIAEEPGWTITATEKGFGAIRQRLRKQ